MYITKQKDWYKILISFRQIVRKWIMFACFLSMVVSKASEKTSGLILFQFTQNKWGSYIQYLYVNVMFFNYNINSRNGQNSPNRSVFIHKTPDYVFI